MNKLIAAVLAAATLAPISAYADHDRDDDCDHGAAAVAPMPPPGQPSQRGHYETRTLQRWVPGFYESVYVPGVCREKKRHHGWYRETRCTPARYEQVWRDGHYENVTQQVWVQDTYYYAPPPPPVVYTQPAPPPPPGRADWQVSTQHGNVTFTAGGRF